MIARRLGKYELQQQLGYGKAGEVWKGYDLQAQHEVAVKIFHSDLQADPNFLARFTRIGQAIASLHHPNIVQVHEVNVARSQDFGDSSAYMVMDYIEGLTLASFISNTSHKGTFPPVADIVYLFTSLGVAIDYAHERAVIHGNINPAAILFNKHDTTHLLPGEPMLTDFAVTSLSGNSNSGNPYYISPEQAKGQTASELSDIYALGVILYELCTGTVPFHAESTVAVMMHHINTLPTPPMLINPHISPALSEVILRALAKDPATRYAMASLLAAALADACALEPGVQITLNKSLPVIHTQASAPIEQRAPILGVSTLPSQRAAMTSSLQPIVKQLTPSPDRTSEPQRQPVPAGQSASSSTTARIPAASHAITPTTLRRERRRINPIFALLYIALVALLLLAGGILAFNAWHQGQTTTSGGTVAGYVFFQDDALGHQDTLHIDIQNIPAPSQGKNYFAWLQETGQTVLPLGSLSFHNGTATFFYAEPHHTNLLSIAQGFFISTENSGSTPATPHGSKVYAGSFATNTFPYIKNILYKLPNFPAQDGVAAGLLENIRSINEKATSIVDSLQGNHDYLLVKRQATRIIELIDGTQYARSSGDLPMHYPSLSYASVGLISSPTISGYIDTLAAQVEKLRQASGNNPSLLQHINNVTAAIADLRDWMQKMRSYDVTILAAQDLSDSGILNVALQLKKLAADTYVGRTLPPNAGPLPIAGSAGANQAYVECQYLATLDLKVV